MDLSSFTLPIVIFVAEVIVVTLGTLRIIFVARGHKFIAPALGFFESFIWLVAISQLMKDQSDWSSFIAFGLGFALGNYLGILVEKWLALGMVSVRIVTHRDANELVDQMRAANFGVTSVEGQGASGKVQIVMTVVKRKQLTNIVSLIETHHPNAFYAVDDVQSTCEGIFPASSERATIIPAPLVKMFRLVLPKAPSGRLQEAEANC